MSAREGLERRRELLERSANRTRERLADALFALDQRRHGLVRYEYQQHKVSIAITAGSLVAAVTGAVGYSVYRLATREQRLREERWKALRRLWSHPERLARKDPPPGSLVVEIGRKVVVATLTFVALELTKRAVRGALPAPEPPALATSIVRTLPA